MLGTHTHIPTADERILAGGTAYQSDVGMTGPYDPVIGSEKTWRSGAFYQRCPSGWTPPKQARECTRPLSPWIRDRPCHSHPALPVMSRWRPRPSEPMIASDAVLKIDVREISGSDSPTAALVAPMYPLWRTHSCVPHSHSCECPG